MGLPIAVCPHADHELPDGTNVPIRGLTRAEALQIRGVVPEGVEAVEKLTIRFACEVSEAEVEQWYGAAANDAVESLVNAIARLSGLDPDVGKAAAGDSPSAPSTASTTSSQSNSTGP